MKGEMELKQNRTRKVYRNRLSEVVNQRRTDNNTMAKRKKGKYQENTYLQNRTQKTGMI